MSKKDNNNLDMSETESDEQISEIVVELCEFFIDRIDEVLEHKINERNAEKIKLSSNKDINESEVVKNDCR